MPAMKEDDKKGERIAKHLARAGIASRRDAEKLILAGRVTVDGKKLEHPAFLVAPGMDVRVDGKPVKAKEPPRLWRYHKPEGLVTSARDPQGRPTVFDNLPKNLPRVISAGRLDLNSEGLLLLTNDGGLARYLEMSDLPRSYRVRVYAGAREIDKEKLERLGKGITIDGFRYKPVKAELENMKGTNAWLLITLQEGKNREIRKIMEHLGYEVNRLIRTGFGPFQLGRIEKGVVEEIPVSLLQKSLPDYFKE
jgi:23S rRNA pseudouridine2605 synthase